MPDEFVCAIQPFMTVWNYYTNEIELIEAALVDDWRPYLPDKETRDFYDVLIETGSPPLEGFRIMLTSHWI